MVDLETLLTDLVTESADLEALVSPLSEADWARPTPAPGWTIAHQIAHLAWTDHAALLAATDAAAFFDFVARAAEDPDGFVDRGAAEYLAPPSELLARWRAGRAALAEALAAAPAGAKMPWYGTQMSPASMATGRLMETWAHGQDVADALGVTRIPSDRLRHVVHIGIRTLGHGFVAHGRPAPTVPVRVELIAPRASARSELASPAVATEDAAAEPWVYGPAEAADRVTGPALDFCLLVTQRRHRADLALGAIGPVADEWLDVAQAFAGPPGAGRKPGAATGREPSGAPA